ncbi:MFS transporter [Marinitoga sp. 38H-ov]|uniref:MFS transporter n=1 Tax=Marinitoga sp. 38H-ov TaxID=1755814 RepID=UPI0013EBB05F|nr:MFS transporter [Marinitoga sp. 38H-ov]KAF2956859.1 MFS transporter [Marinitoga sp. 38H-ov]
MKKAQLIFGFSSFFIFGFSLILNSTLIPIIEKAYSIDHSLVGLVLSLGSVAFLISSLLYGYLLEKMNAFYVIVSGVFVLLFGNLTMFFMNSYIMLIIGMFLINFGGGALEVSVPFLIGVSGDGKKGKILNLLHASFAMGAVISPIISSLVLRYTPYWKSSYLLAVLINLIPLISVYMIKHDILNLHADYLEDSKGSLREVLNSSLIILVLALSFYVGYEMNFTSWISTFLYEVRNFDVSNAAIFPSFLWLGLFLGRSLLSGMPEKFGYKKWLFIVVFFSVVFSTFTILLGKNIILSAIGTILTGLSYATTYPTIQAIIVEKYKRNKGIALSISSAATSIISGGFSYVIGLVGTLYGLFAGLIIIIVVNIIELLFISLLKEN